MGKKSIEYPISDRAKKKAEKIDKLKIKRKIISNTAYLIIIGALVTAFALVFANALLEWINSILGEVNTIVNLLVTLILLIISILILLRVQNKKKKWESLAEEHKIEF